MAPYFVFNCTSYRKSLIKTNVTYYKCANCDHGYPARLIVRNNEISEKPEHNCEANCLVIQILAPNLSLESFVDTLIFEKASQLILYHNQIFRALLLPIRDQFVNPRIASHRKINGVYRKEFDPRSQVSSIKSSSKQPTFLRSYWVGDIQGVEHKMMIFATNQSFPLIRYNGHTFVDGTFRTTPSLFYQ
ncbi:hypothetical protein HZS_1399 [Henneguya salminicola]|nr:hypothetical protein HZS_1399 [Henneguya salminicola]